MRRAKAVIKVCLATLQDMTRRCRSRLTAKRTTAVLGIVLMLIVPATVATGWGYVQFARADKSSETTTTVGIKQTTAEAGEQEPPAQGDAANTATAGSLHSTTTDRMPTVVTTKEIRLTTTATETAAGAAIAATTTLTSVATTAATTTTAAATAATTAATTRATTQATAAATSTVPVPEEPFYGIDPAITALWQFPLKVETHTPSQGVFGARRSGSRLHAGIDLYAPDGTEVYAMTAGRVSRIYLFYESLLAIEVDNDDGTTLRYTELTPLVKVGDRVEQGQLIARLKRNSSGSCMLHLEVYATVGSAPLTQVDNNRYDYVSARSGSFMRRSDLVDPSAVYQLTRP